MAVPPKLRSILAGFPCLLLASVPSAGAGEASWAWTRLENGLGVVAVQDSSATLAAVEIIHRVGSAQDPPGREGTAHLLEHVRFGTSRGYPLPGIIPEVNLLTAFNQGSTYPWKTVYTDEFLPPLLAEVLALEADRLGFLEFREDVVEREKRVVAEENLFRSRDTPSEELQRRLFHALYPGHPLGRWVDRQDSIAALIGAEDLAAFHAATMGAGTAVVLVTGPLPTDDMIAGVREAFAALPPGPEVPPLPTYPPPEKRTVVLDRSDLEGFVCTVGIRLAAGTPRDRARAHLLGTILDEGRTGLDAWAVPGERVVFLRYHSDYYRGPDGSERTEPNRDVAYIWGRVWEDIDDGLVTLGKPEEFARLRDRAVHQVGGYRSAQALGEDLADRLLAGEEPDDVFQLADTLAVLTGEEMLAYAREMLDPHRAVNGVVHGKDSGRESHRYLAAVGGAAVVDTFPDPFSSLDGERIGPVLDLYRDSGLARLETGTLGNGTRVLLWPVPGSDRMEVRYLRRFPALDDSRPGHRQGITLLYSWMAHWRLDKKERRRFEHGLDVTLWPWQLELRVAGRPEDLAEALGVLGERLETQGINSRSWRYYLDHPQAVTEESSYPAEMVAAYRRARFLLPEDSACLGAYRVSPSFPDGFKYRDFEKLHETVRKRGEPVVLAAGDLQLATLKMELARTVGKWKPSSEKGSSPPEEPAGGTPRGVIVPDFERRECRVQMEYPGVAESTAWPERRLVGEVLSRALESALRQTQGVSYGAGARFDERAGTWCMSLGWTVGPADAPASMRSYRRMLRELLETGLGEARFAQARLAVVKDLFATGTDPGRAAAFLEELSGDPSLSPDLVRAVLEVDRDRVEALLRSAVGSPGYVFSVVGPILEDELPAFEE